MLTDNEVRGVAEDALHFKALGQTLKEIICSTGTPITIGVYGEWGSGKSSLMRITQDLLENQNTGFEVRTVWFDAWKYDRTHDLRVALIHTILREMQKEKKMERKVKRLLERINWLGLGRVALSSFLPLSFPLQQEPVLLLKDSKDAPKKALELISDFEDEFKDLAKEYVSDGGRLVIFIDDLDRCLPEKAISVLEAIKLFLNVQQSVFVIGADKKVILEGIRHRFGENFKEWGREYLDKIIQIPVNMPPLRKDTIKGEFFKNLKVSKEIRKYADIITEVGNNPRTIKRLINKIEIQRILANKTGLKVKSGVLVLLAVIEFRWPDFYAWLISTYCETQTNMIQKLEEISKCGEAERAQRLEEWRTLKKYIDDKKFMDFLFKRGPRLEGVNLDPYVYTARSTTELIKSAESYYNIANSHLLEKEEYSEAIENYEKAIEANPEYGDAWNNKGVASGKLGRHEEAIKCFDEAIRLNTEDENAWNNKGFALTNLGRHEEATKCFDEAIKLNPNHRDAWNNKGYALINLGRHEEATKCFDEAIKLNPQYGDTWNNKGFALINLGRHEEATKCFDEAIKLNPQYGDAWNNKGYALIQLERYEEAIECSDEAIRQIPEDERIWDNKGYALIKLGKYEEAIECFDEAIKLNPQYGDAWNNKGFALIQLERYEEAIECFDEAIKLNPQYGDTWNNKGFALIQLERYEEAIECSDEAIKLNSENARAWHIGGQALEQLGEMEKAKKYFQKAKELGFQEG